MNTQPSRNLEDLLRDSLQQVPDADYDALVAGVHRRAAAIRRRRVVTSGLAAAVLVPALTLGGVALLDRAPTTPPDGPVAPMIGTEPGPATEAPPTTELPSPAPDDGPPWQDGELPLPEGGIETGTIPNAWDIPDARPTGVELLDDLGAPQHASDYPRIAPLTGVMACNDLGNEDGLEPVAGQSWSYWEQGPFRGVEITVTGWEDSLAAMQGLAEDSLHCAWDDGARAQVEWLGHPEDYLNEPVEGTFAGWYGIAAVRQGDYLVGVTVQHDDSTVAHLTAQEIAVKTAENLAVLDPEHGG